MQFPKGPLDVYKKTCTEGCKQFLYYCDKDGKKIK